MKVARALLEELEIASPWPSASQRRNTPAAMPQGSLKKLKKIEKKAKPKRGDQQKLGKGKRDLRPKAASARVQDDQQRQITKMIVQKIEKTMAGRASTDHASLKLLTADDGMKSDQLRKNPKESNLLKKSKR